MSHTEALHHNVASWSKYTLLFPSSPLWCSTSNVSLHWSPGPLVPRTGLFMCPKAELTNCKVNRERTSPLLASSYFDRNSCNKHSLALSSSLLSPIVPVSLSTKLHKNEWNWTVKDEMTQPRKDCHQVWWPEYIPRTYMNELSQVVLLFTHTKNCKAKC